MEIEKSGPITVLIQVLNHFLLVFELYMGAIIIYRQSGGRGGGGRRIFEGGSHGFQGELRGISRRVGYRILTYSTTTAES